MFIRYTYGTTVCEGNILNFPKSTIEDSIVDKLEFPQWKREYI